MYQQKYNINICANVNQCKCFQIQKKQEQMEKLMKLNKDKNLFLKKTNKKQTTSNYQNEEQTSHNVIIQCLFQTQKIKALYQILRITKILYRSDLRQGFQAFNPSENFQGNLNAKAKQEAQKDILFQRSRESKNSLKIVTTSLEKVIRVVDHSLLRNCFRQIQWGIGVKMKNQLQIDISEIYHSKVISRGQSFNFDEFDEEELEQTKKSRSSYDKIYHGQYINQKNEEDKENGGKNYKKYGLNSQLTINQHEHHKNIFNQSSNNQDYPQKNKKEHNKALQLKHECQLQNLKKQYEQQIKLLQNKLKQITIQNPGQQSSYFEQQKPSSLADEQKIEQILGQKYIRKFYELDRILDEGKQILKQIEMDGSLIDDLKEILLVGSGQGHSISF